MKQFLKLEKYTAAYTIEGKGFPLILLHGFFGDSETLSLLSKQLSFHFQCISLEMLGFGDSSKPNIEYNIDKQVSFIQDFVEHLGLEKFNLLGYSYGAWAGSAYAVKYQSRINQLALIAPSGIRDDGFVGRYKYLKPLLWQTRLVDWAISLYKPIAYWKNDQAGYRKIAQARHALMTQPAAASMLKNRLKLREQWIAEDSVDTVEKDIHKILLPTIVVAAENDTTIPRWHSDTFAASIPNTEYHIVPNADHDFISTHTAQITALLNPFFEISKQSAPIQTKGRHH